VEPLISWNIPREQWERARKAVAEHAPGSRYDEYQRGRYHLLLGDIDFAWKGTSLYSDGGINISLFDISVALASAWLETAFAPGSRCRYSQLDDERHIDFVIDREVTIVAVDEMPTPLTVPREAFERGVRTFLEELAAAMQREAPGLLAWHSLRPVREAAQGGSAA
jgi:hypothetical protein